MLTGGARLYFPGIWTPHILMEDSLMTLSVTDGHFHQSEGWTGSDLHLQAFMSRTCYQTELPSACWSVQLWTWQGSFRAPYLSRINLQLARSLDCPGQRLADRLSTYYDTILETLLKRKSDVEHYLHV